MISLGSSVKRKYGINVGCSTAVTIKLDAIAVVLTEKLNFDEKAVRICDLYCDFLGKLFKVAKYVLLRILTMQPLANCITDK